MGDKTHNQKQVVVILDEDELERVDRPETQHRNVNPFNSAQTPQSSATQDRISRPYNRTVRPSSSNKPRQHQPPFGNIHLTSSAATTAGLCSQPANTSSTSFDLSSQRFGIFRTQPPTPSMKPLPRFDINTDITIVRPRLATGSDQPEREVKRPKLGLSDAEVVDLDPGGFLAGDYMTEEQVYAWLQQSQGKHAPAPPMRAARLSRSARPIPAKGSPRNILILAPFVCLKSYNHAGNNLRPNTNVELHNGDFMRIVHVIRNNSTLAVSLRGHVFQRTREMNGVLRKALNEICWVLHVDEDDQREQSIQAMGEVPVSHVVKRRAIKITNQPFPALSFRTDLLMDETEEAVSRNRVLVCRWKYLCYYRSAEARERNAYSQRVIQRIQMGESDANCAVKDEQLRYNWRGNTTKGGAASEGTASGHLVPIRLGGPATSQFALDPIPVIDLESPTTRRNSQKYHSQLDSGGRSGGTSILASAQHREPVMNCPPATFPCVSFDSIISIADNPDPDFGMNLRTRGDSHVMRLQGSEDKLQSQARRHSPEVTEVEGYMKATTNKGIVEQAYQGKITSWRSHPPPSHWSRGVFNSGASSPSDVVQRRRSRGSSADSDRTIRGRSSSVEFLGKVLKHTVPSCPDFQLSQQTVSRASPGIKHTHGYTYGDGFCGAGGMSRGAVMAGLNVKWGFDYNELACRSYLLNFRSSSTTVYCLSADQFSSLQGEDHKVDVLHLSPPCQTFSPAHTINGKDDDQNSASLFAVSELLKKARPRVVTLEQTAGLKTLYPQYLNALVQMFTENGFNIRYKICHLQEYGIPQTRSRLIIIASCPGETLPEYPKPTHSSNPQHTGLRPLMTINKAIRNIPPDAADHDLATVVNTSAGPPYDGNRQTNCITTSGGGAYHPSGRKFTHREIACLNGFPLEHRFCGKGTKKQIGNAVPPLVGKIFLEAVRKALEKADGL